MHPASLALLLAATQSASSFDYVYVSTKYSWANASSNCQSHGAELASLHSSADEDNARENSGGGAAWIGFNDRTSEGSWVWSDGTTGNYTNWNGGEPNDSGSGEDCTALRRSGGWNDGRCSTELQSLCKHSWTCASTCAAGSRCTVWETSPCALCPANTYSATQNSAGCLVCKPGQFSMPGARNCTNSTIFKLVDEKKTFDDAEELCNDLGLSLASINSIEEANEAVSLAATVGSGALGCWIGLTDSKSEGSWKWTDGRAVNFTAWSDGEPNDFTTDNGLHNWGEDCVVVSSNFDSAAHSWNDLPCDSERASLCRNMCDQVTQECQPGTQCQPGNQCTDCPIGKYASTVNTPCKRCPSGKFADQIRSSHCQDCPSLFTSEKGSADCSTLTPGFIAMLVLVPLAFVVACVVGLCCVCCYTQRDGYKRYGWCYGYKQDAEQCRSEAYKRLAENFHKTSKPGHGTKTSSSWMVPGVQESTLRQVIADHEAIAEQRCLVGSWQQRSTQLAAEAQIAEDAVEAADWHARGLEMANTVRRAINRFDRMQGAGAAQNISVSCSVGGMQGYDLSVNPSFTAFDVLEYLQQQQHGPETTSNLWDPNAMTVMFASEPLHNDATLVEVGIADGALLEIVEQVWATPKELALEL